MKRKQGYFNKQRVHWIKWSLVGVALPLPRAWADDLYASGWGAAFNASPEGTLVFIIIQCAGLYACIKSLCLLYAWHHGKQNRYGTGACIAMFFAGSVLFYPHEVLNLIYNSI